MLSLTKSIKIKSIRPVQQQEVVCDVSVADNHNLFVCDGVTDIPMLAHNCHDENRKVLDKSGTPQYNLEQIFTNYQNDFYRQTEFGKSERTLIATVELADPNVLNYCSMDVQCMFGIHDEQIKRSQYSEHNGSSFTPIYHRNVLLQQNSLSRMMGTMRSRGVRVDVNYLLELLKPNSPVIGYIDKLSKEFYSLPEVAQANERLKDKRSIPKGSMFGSNVSSRVFDRKTKEHQQVLFIDVLKLEPLRVSYKTQEPSFDKFFLQAYKDTCKAAELQFRLNTISTIKSSFIDPFFKFLEASFDSRVDQRIRPEFGYVKVVTGRSNSSKPSLQQIPEHSEDAKLVKRMFVTMLLHLHYEADYSAHEVRMWGMFSDDKVLAKTFKIIHRLIRRYRLNPTPENAEEVKVKGDPHKVNYSFFTGVKIELIDKPMRQDSKGITFGAMYGMSLKSLARSIKKTLEEATEIYNRFFGKFHQAGSWLKWAISFSREHLYVFTPTGRRRNLFGYLSAHRAVQAAMERRAQNSPVQGGASDICFDAADLFARALHECLTELGVEHDTMAVGSTTKTWQPTGPNAMVHDSIKGEAPLAYYLLHIHLLEWAMTNGVRDFLRDYYQFETNAPFEIEFEIGCDWSRKSKWDWSEAQLSELILKAIDGHKTLYPNEPLVQELDPQETLAMMQECYQQQAKLLDLDNRFPRNF